MGKYAKTKSKTAMTCEKKGKIMKLKNKGKITIAL